MPLQKNSNTDTSTVPVAITTKQLRGATACGLLCGDCWTALTDASHRRLRPSEVQLAKLLPFPKI